MMMIEKKGPNTAPKKNVALHNRYPHSNSIVLHCTGWGVVHVGIIGITKSEMVEREGKNKGKPRSMSNLTTSQITAIVAFALIGAIMLGVFLKIMAAKYPWRIREVTFAKATTMKDRPLDPNRHDWFARVPDEKEAENYEDPIVTLD